MGALLVQGCSKSKQEVSDSIQAFNLYSGYFYKIIKKAKRDDEYRNDIDISILSAKYGLIDPDEEIKDYDLKMTHDRAEELRPTAVEDLESKIKTKQYDMVIINLGKHYREAISGIESRVDVDVNELSGGLGERGHQLKNIIRGSEVMT